MTAAPRAPRPAYDRFPDAARPGGRTAASGAAVRDRRPARPAARRRRRHRDGLRPAEGRGRGDVLGQRDRRRRRGRRGSRAPLGSGDLLRDDLDGNAERPLQRRPSGAVSCPGSRSTRCPTASPRRRCPTSSRCSSWRWRWPGGRWTTRGSRRARFDPSRTAVVFGTESNSDYHSGDHPSRDAARLLRRGARGTRRGAAAASRPTPFPESWATSSPAGSPTGSISAARRTSSTRPAGPPWPRSTWPARNSSSAPRTSCCAAGRTCTTAASTT